MSEDDRAAKAARAKAMLKKRQQKKAEGVPPSSKAASPIISQSRTFSPAPSESIDDDRRDIGEVFTKDDSDTSWMSSLPRLASPPPRPSTISPPPVNVNASANAPLRPPVTSPPPGAAESASVDRALMDRIKFENESLAAEMTRLRSLLDEQGIQYRQLDAQFEKYQVEKDAVLQNGQRTISLLVSEKASLTAELERLQDMESRTQTTEVSLQEERVKSENLDQHVNELKSQVQELSQRAQQSHEKELELGDRCRDQERQLQLTNASLDELREEAEQYRRKVRELEEQIQSDDRVERLESSLKNIQDRADELEFQLSKSKQTYVALKSERDDIDSQRRLHSDNELEWKNKHLGLTEQHSATLEQLSTLISDKDILTKTNTDLQSQFESTQHALKDVQNRLSLVASELASNTHQLETAQSELRNANRRAEDAEKTQRDLQAEGTNLMRSLDEMRPKIVELTGEKLELGEKIDNLEHALRNRDVTISQLEQSLDEARDQKESSNLEWQEALSIREKEHSSVIGNFAEMQKAYVKLEEELQTSLSSIQYLEADRSNSRHEAARQLEEINGLSATSQTQTEELRSLRQELDERRSDQEEAQDILERAQAEIETLCAELNAKDEELQRYQEAEAPRSLDAEMLSSLRQQHALDLSAAQSQIRALENSVFDAEARAHAMQKQVHALEDRLQSASRGAQRSFSPSIPSRPSSRNHNSVNDPRRGSFGSHRPTSHLAPPLSRSVFDQNLSADTRHKRKVSLSMLKARIDSEAFSNPSSRALSPVSSLPTVKEPSSAEMGGHNHGHSHGVHRPQFLDESHVFWCHSCQGDLVIL